MFFSIPFEISWWGQTLCFVVGREVQLYIMQGPWVLQIDILSGGI